MGVEEVRKGGEAALVFIGVFCEGEINVTCPRCNESYIHPARAGTLMGGDEGIEYEGTFVTGSTSSRRSALEVVFDCEHCPKQFAVVFQQHKGQTFIEVHLLDSAGPMSAKTGGGE